MTDRVSNRFRGGRGERYFVGQQRAAATKALLAERKFRPYYGPGDRVVDFGSAAGHLLDHLRVREATGVDVNPLNQRLAKAFGRRVVARTEELPDEATDVVVSHHTLEHVLDPYEELRQLHRILVPGGRLVLILPIDDWRRQRAAEPADPDNHLFTWTPRLIANLLKEAGFAVKEARVRHHAYPGRLTFRLARLLPSYVFDGVAFLTAFVTRRRELLAIGLKK
jgi:SAM-dependent methyltransferase